jgi:HD superfamily phosphohydrolase/tRNA A-37 threonylcarbamoyl transferase component Bud32
MMVEPPTAETLLLGLEAVYTKRGKQSDFAAELPTYQILIPELLAKLSAGYVLESPLNLGSTATVWAAVDKELGQKRALKLARPRFMKLQNIVEVIRAEGEKLAELNHTNIIKVYSLADVSVTEFGNNKVEYPYFLMEYFEELDDLDKFVLKHLDSLRSQELILLFRDLMAGLSYLHSKGVFHCDIKPGNLLVGPQNRALVADLGYSKKRLLKMPSDIAAFTDVNYTPQYAHPELRRYMTDSKDSAANVAKLPASDLREAFDLFAFGRSMQEVLSKVRNAERADAKKQYGAVSVCTPYQWRCLAFISKRLLDGIVERGGDDLNTDLIPGLSDQVMTEIRYRTADEALEDFEKLLNLYDLEGMIPELNANIREYIQIPLCQVPKTPRVEAVINHPVFRRLSQVSQLGFLVHVYPGASHSRYEHALGTFCACCGYVRSLWYDQTNCLFQMIMSQSDIELGLVAALLHDIGQYPMAHDLTEVHSGFGHERFTELALLRCDDPTERTLASVVQERWGVKTADILSVLLASRDSPFRHRILHSLISGPLDCDKLDYLRRDSVHLGVGFGATIDCERLLRNMTLIYESAEETKVGPDGREFSVRSLDVAEIGVTEKALVVANSVWRARRDMFTQVYWQHTARALKAMLGFVVRAVLSSVETDERGVEEFWEQIEKFFFVPKLHAGVLTVSTREEVAGATKDDDPASILDEQDRDCRHPLANSCNLSLGDDALLTLLWKYCGEDERLMILAIRARALYRRLAVVSAGRDEAVYSAIYDRFRACRLANDVTSIERMRRRWQDQILDYALDRASSDLSLLPRSLGSIDALEDALRRSNPVILVDVPIKTTRRLTRVEVLRYLPEDYSGIHFREPMLLPRFAGSKLDLEQVRFDREVGKIRVFSHPAWRDFLVKCVPERALLEMLSR